MIEGEKATHLEVKLKDERVWYYNIVPICIWSSGKINNF